MSKKNEELIQIYKFNDILSNLSFNSIFNINYNIKLSFNNIQNEYINCYLYKINTNQFEVNNTFKSNIVTKLGVSSQLVENELNNIPSRNRTIFSNLENNILKCKTNYELGNEIDISDLYNYYKSVDLSIKDGSIRLVSLDYRGIECRKENVYLLHSDGKLYSTGDDVNPIKNFDFG